MANAFRAHMPRWFFGTIMRTFGPIRCHDDVFARMPNGGIASVSIDGVAREPIDMYYPIPDWQHKVGYCCFTPGRHVVVIRSTGEKNPASSGFALDLDSFSVLD